MSSGSRVLALMAALVFATLRPFAAAQTKFYTLDLKGHCNFALTNALIGKGPIHGPNHLGALPVGESMFAGVPFNVSGILQLASKQSVLAGKSFPPKIEGISLNNKASIIHLLHGAGWDDEADAAISKMLLHYKDGLIAEAQIVYGRHVCDWWDNNIEHAPSDPATALAWQGHNRVSRMFGTDLRLYRTPFKNPRPEVEIERISFVSNHRNAASFIVGVTIESL